MATDPAASDSVTPEADHGPWGRLAHSSARSRLTPLLALFAFILGVFAALVTPREEEPQIDVTMANVFVPFPGAGVADVETLVTVPMEQILAEIRDVEHVHAMSRPGMAVLTVQFEVGVPRTEALVRLYDAIEANADWRPRDLGVGQVLVRAMGIDDVPIVALTLTTDDPARGALELTAVAHALESELKRVPGTRTIDTIGGVQATARVLLSPAKLMAHGIALDDLRGALQAHDVVQHAGTLVADDRAVPVQAGTYFARADELGELVVGIHDGRPVYLEAVADIEFGAPENTHYVSHLSKDGGVAPAVTLAVGKKPGENAVDVANAVLDRVAQLRGVTIPDGVDLHVTRNYGATANEKANKLIQKLVFASLSVIALVALTMGRREAVVVGAAVVLTLAATLFASLAWGFTLNRVSLFALIFSIGILVDDAIVVVENIHRHMRLGGRRLLDVIPVAVGEVGGPTVLATFTVIAALLPMAFVTGLMGPYMSPIPINASMGMFISLVVAFTFTPWLTHRLLAHEVAAHGAEGAPAPGSERLFRRVMTPFLGDARRLNRYGLVGALMLLIVLACLLAVFKLVVLKMLPFDDKSEFQVVVDLPEGSALEHTSAVLNELGAALLKIDEVTDVQIYAGTAAPIGFNGLVRQYYLRAEPQLGDIQVNLRAKHDRARPSHEIALAARPALAAIGAKYDAAVKVVEVPPGPPVLAPLVAEVYGPDYRGQIEFARALRERFAQTADVVDVDATIDTAAPRYVVHVERARAAQLGVGQQQVADALATVLGGDTVAYLRTGHARYPVPIRLDFPPAAKAHIDDVLQTPVRSTNGALVPLAAVASVETARREQTVYRKDLLPVVYVTGDVAGALDSPLYGMFDLVGQLGDDVAQYFTQQPATPFDY
ncbi:MAG: efflux RND transporter permease subunit, partial [Pseudomonadota bacterium]|nr:efflux RND transporter permease subunit [Pseudomonadota bacterium]